MPRSRRLSADMLVARALPVFWHHGYATTSVDDLTRHIGGSRQAIYGCFADKRRLLLACLAAYRDQVVSPAFGRVEQPGAGLAEVAAYFEHQIAAAETHGLPGPGCLIGNLAGEAIVGDAEVGAAIAGHLARLRAGFRGAVATHAAGRLPATALDDVAALLATAAQGLWSVSRVATDAGDLRRVAATLVDLVRKGCPP